VDLDPLLLEVLVCPKCHSPLAVNDPGQTLDCTDTAEPGSCGLRYPVRDDIPVMLIDEAAPPTPPGPAPVASAS
jgi:uncharacterized protein YbaR (Trm112 family)